MPKHDKNKVARTTLFGEKFAKAWAEKADVKKPKPTVQAEENLPLTVSPAIIEPLKPIEEITAKIVPTEPKIEAKTSENETNNNKSNSGIAAESEPTNEFRQIMERHFAENAKCVKPLIRLGIDLGTSYSKVVWRLGEETVFPVCFGKNDLSLNNYLMPSVIGFERERIVFGFEALPFADSSISNFKMCLACESKDDGDCNIKKCSLTNWKPEFFAAALKNEETKFVNALFLAKLLARTKKIILAELTEKQGFPATVKPKWTANYAVPDTFIEQSEIAAAFREVLRMAWLIAEILIEKPELDDRQTLAECYFAAQGLAKESSEILDDEEFGCSPYPEVGAEVASIVMPKTSLPGLYAFVDVGAGTIDASVFRYFRDGKEAKRPPYAANVVKLGAAHIETRANQQFIKHSAHWLKEVKEEYVSLTDHERGRLLKPIISFLKEAAHNIKDEARQSLIEVFSQAYHEKECDVAQWQDLKLVLGGGGSKLKSYQDAAIQAFTLNRNGKEQKKPATVILQKPGDFQMSGLPEAEFHRFAVAYGLSHDIAQLPETIFAKDVAPVRKVLEKRNTRDRDDDR